MVYAKIFRCIKEGEMNNIKIKKWMPIVLITFILLTSISWANNDELKRKERELEELRKKIEEVDASIDANKNLQSQTASNIRNVSTSIKSLEKEIKSIDGSIKDTEANIEQKTFELAEAVEKINDKNELLNDRLRVMYKTGSVGYLEVLFGAEDFTDLLSRIDMVQKILVHDQNLIVFLKEQRDIIETKKTELEGIKLELVAFMKNKQTKQGELERDLKSLLSYKESLQKDQAALAELEQAFIEEADQLTNIIKNLQLAATYVGGEMMWPVPGEYNITSPFGSRLHPIAKVERMHTGIDIACSRGTPVVAAQSGSVIYSGWYGGYGKVIIMDHGGGYSTLYAHNDSLLVQVGDKVNKGDLIAKSGNTGYSTGPHLHFEVRINGDYVDPIKYVKGK